MFFTIVIAIVALCAVFGAGWIAGGGLTRMSENNLHKTRLKHTLPHIQDLRDQVPGNSGFEGIIIRHVEEGWFSWEELGTTQEELERLSKRLEGKQWALSIISRLRIGTDGYEKYLTDLPKALAQAELTLSDIGTSEAEIADFPRQCDETIARRYWNEACFNASQVEVCLSWVAFALRGNRISPKDFGATGDELRRYQRAFA